MRVAYHGSYLPWMEVGRTELIRELGYSYKRLESEGIFMPVIRIEVDYLRSVHYDDTVHIDAWIASQEGIRTTIAYICYRDSEPVARGFTTHAFTDRQNKPVRPPKEFIACLKKGI